MTRRAAATPRLSTAGTGHPRAPHSRSLARCFVCAQPLDVTKTRLQLDKTGRYKGMVHCGKTIAAEEGVASLYKGLAPFVTHLTIKYALRFGSYAFFQSSISSSSAGATSDSKLQSLLPFLVP